MHALPPLVLAVPLLSAALLAALNAVLPRALTDAASVACALAVTAMCALLTLKTGGLTVYWFGGFHPRAGVAVGISFAVDSIGAGMATLSAFMVSAALVYSVRYFEEIGSLYGALMLVFLAAMVGFCLTGDLFNLFVFFELMSVAAYALTAYKIEEAGPLQGAINFAITNSVGSFAMLSGIALLYGRTGALNMAQVGAALSGHRVDGLVTVALLLIMGGLLVKAAIVPLHFWLADAHAVAPVPVCVLFSGVMVELALYGLARVYWTIFSGPMSAHAAGLRATLVVLGAATAIVGATMCLAQRHLKRLLAFSTISHTGTFLLGLGLLTPAGLAASARYVPEHALLKGALFMAAGILLHRFGTVDEHDLRGRGRERTGRRARRRRRTRGGHPNGRAHARDPGLRVAALVFAAGGLGLAALPPLGSFYGKATLEDALSHKVGYGWVAAIVVASSAMTAGAILRATGRIFVGWGPRLPRHLELLRVTSEVPETRRPHDRTPAVMFVPPLLLAGAGVFLGVFTHATDGIGAAAARLTDRAGYAAHVLSQALSRANGAPRAPHESVVALDYVLAATTVVGALAISALALMKRPAWLGLPRIERRATAAIVVLRRVHSGCVNDYVAWLVAGLAAIGGALALS